MQPFSYVPSQQARKDLTYGKFDWTIAETQYQQKRYFEALCSTINYLDADLGERLAADPQTGIMVYHGSVQMNIKVDNGQLQVLAPFLDISNAQKTAVLRKVCEMNFNELNLAAIECKDDNLCFAYRCPLEACDPWKIYEVLKEISWTADKCDDTMVALYQATWICKPNITPFSDSRKQQSWLGFKQYLLEAKEWTSYCKQIGDSYLAWDVLYMTFVKIDQLCSPQGSLKNVLESSINRLYDKREISESVNGGIDDINFLDTITQSVFFLQLYDVQTFIPSKVTGSALNVQSSLKQYLTETYNYITKGDIVVAYLCILKAAFRLTYNYRFTETQWQHLETIYADVHQLSITDATNKLYDGLNDFYNNPRDQFEIPTPIVKEKKTSVFSSWFS